MEQGTKNIFLFLTKCYILCDANFSEEHFVYASML